MKHSTLLPKLRFLLLALAGLLCSLPAARADEIELLVVAKEQRFVQTNASAPVLHTNLEERFGIFVLIQADLETIFTSAILSNSVFGEMPLDGELGGPVFENHGDFSTKAELDMNVPPGTYTFHLGTDNGSNFAATVTLPADAYPNAPHIANWAAAQNIDPFADFTLTWAPMTSGGAQDFIFVNIQSNEGDEDEIFVSPFIGQPGRLTGQSNSVVIPAGTLQPGVSYRVNVTFVNFVLSDTNILGGGFLGAGFVKETELSITIENVPAEGRIQFASTNLVILEGNTNLEVNLVRVGGSQGEVSAVLRSVNLTATAGADYDAFAQELAFGDGETNLTVLIPIHDDFLLEGSERFRLGLSEAAGGATLTRDTNAIVTITDSENTLAGELSFSAAAYQATESTGVVVKVIVRRTSGTAGAVGATIEIFGGTASNGDDYEAVPGNTFAVAIADGKNASTNEIIILDDDLPEGAETIRLRLTEPTGGAILGAIGTNTTTILDDEITIQFESLLYTNVENKVEAKVTVARTGPTTEGAAVDYTTLAPLAPPIGFIPANGASEAEPGADYLAGSGTVFFARGVTEKTFTVRLIDDLAVEEFEIIRLALSSPSNALLGPLTNASLYIKDNDHAGKFTFTLSSQNVKEPSARAKIIVIRTGGLASNVTVRLSTQDGTATNLADYIGFSSNLVFGPKEVKKTIPVSVIQDALEENKENFSLTLRDPSPDGTLGRRTNLTVNISDDDEGGKVFIDKALYTANETNGTLAIIVKRSGGSASNVTARLFTENGTATADNDYTALDVNLNFGPGETRKTNVLTILNDDIADSLVPEFLHLRLREIGGGAKLGASNSIVVIVDDETGVSFGTNALMGSEGGSVTIPIVRSGFLGETSRVDYMMMDGTATNGLDYTAVSGFVIFNKGEFLKTVKVRLTVDPNVDTNETFTVVLKNATNALYSTHTNLTITIMDKPDDDAVDLDGGEFIKHKARKSTGDSFSRDYLPKGTDAQTRLGTLTGGLVTVQGTATELSSDVGTESISLQISPIAGTGIYLLDEGVVTVTYIKNKLSGAFGYVTDDALPGTITVDGYNGSKISGRYDVYLKDTEDDGNVIHVVGSFRMNLDGVP